MAVRFILGRAGAGKTHWCFDQIVESLTREPLGPAIFWLLPRQATFQAERLLACTAPKGGYFRVRAVSFEDLGREILAECGGTAAAEISDLGRRMILGHLLRQLQPRLKFFQQVAHQPGVAGELDATFSELQRSGQDAAAVVQQLAGGPEPAALNPSLAAKLHDLSILWSAYTDFLGQERLDPERRLDEALASIERCPSLRQADVYVDSFYEFTGYERRVLAALAKVCRSVSITLSVDPKNALIANPHLNPDEMYLFHRTQVAYRRLWFTFAQEKLDVAPPLLLTQPHRFENAALARLERWETAPSADDPGQSIQLVEAADRRGEVDAAARWIGEQVAAGMRYRDIAVLMRSEEEYRDLIDASFREHGIPFFIDRRRTASHHPLLRLIRAAVLIARDNFSTDGMTMAIKTSLVGLEDDQADELENYVLLHGVRGSMWTSPRPWSGHRRPRDEDSDAAGISPDLQRVDATRRTLVKSLMPFVKTVTASKKINVGTLAKAVFDLLEAFEVRSKIVRWMNDAATQGRLEERGEHERVWGELIKLFDEMVQLFSNEPMTLEDFGAIVDSALAGFELALTPPTTDQVLVGAVDRTRTPPIKAAAVLGLSEGQFPRSCREGTVLSDSDRRALIRHDIDVNPDTQRQLLDENFLGYIAFTRASDRLLLTRPAADVDDRPTGPSPLWRQVQQQFPALQPHRPPREQDLPLEQISTPRQLVSCLMRKVRQDAMSDEWVSVYQWLATRREAEDSLHQTIHLAWKALNYRNEAHLQAPQAAAMFASPLHATISQLESFRSCPYQHFARYGLGLSPRLEREVTGADLSQVYHDVLDQLVRQMIGAKRNWSQLDETQSSQVIADLTNQLGRELRGELMLSTARNRYLLARIEKTLRAVAAAQKAAGERGEFVPRWANVRFGAAGSGPADLPPLTVGTPGGNEIQLRGKIDRVDVSPDGSACAIDYRLDPKPPRAPRMFYGLSLQLLTCLLVLEKNGQQLNGGNQLTPAAALCVQLLRKVQSEDPQSVPFPDDPAFHLRIKPRGLFDVRYAAKLDKSLSEGQSDVVQLYIKKDGGIGRPNTSDAAASDQFAALLRHVQRLIGEMADRIIAGHIDVRPYRLGTATPCSHCQFRDLCRFEPSPGAYAELPRISRQEMLQKVVES